jgi:Lrp/AsnC family transcriptional regulator for asnA, asnC and gidA
MRAHAALDPLDVEIIRLLQRDGRMPYSTIAKKFHLAEGTVRKRVSRLLEEGYLRIVGVAVPFKVGMDVISIIGLNVVRQKMTQARTHLQQLGPVRYVAITTGTFDYIIEVVLPSMQDLLHFLLSDLAGVPGLTHTETSLVLEIPKQSYDWLPSALTPRRKGGRSR